MPLINGAAGVQTQAHLITKPRISNIDYARLLLNSSKTIGGAPPNDASWTVSPRE